MASVQWCVSAKIKEGKLDDFKACWAKACALTAAEADSVYYEAFVNEATGDMEIFEKYSTSEGVMVHMGDSFPQFAEELTGCVDIIPPAKLSGFPNDTVMEVIKCFHI